MSVKEYPANTMVKTFDTGELVGLGSFKTKSHRELKHVRLMIFKSGNLAGSERLRLNIYTDSGLTKKIYTGSWANLSDAEMTGIHWLGRLRFDFDRCQINKNSTYYLALESDSYIRVPSFYLSAVLNWTSRTYGDGTLSPYPAHFELFGYMEDEE